MLIIDEPLCSSFNATTVRSRKDGPQLEWWVPKPGQFFGHSFRPLEYIRVTIDRKAPGPDHGHTDAEGIAFFTKSGTPLPLPGGAELVTAGRIWVPGS